MTVREYQVIGRKLPTEDNPQPALWRMRIFARNKLVAQSRYWYFLKQLRKVKKTTGEIVAINEISEKRPMVPKVYGIWLRYDSRSGTVNMYKEFPDTTRTGAVQQLYADMAARHRTRFRGIQILKVVALKKKDDVKRGHVRSLLNPKLKFPLPHRHKAKLRGKQVFAAHRPKTFY